MLRLAFADLQPSEVDASTRELLFTEADAETIWAFVERHRAEAERLVIHCDAGHSRSPAIAAAIEWAYGGDPEPFFRRYEPNPHVYEALRAAWRRRG